MLDPTSGQSRDYSKWVRALVVVVGIAAVHVIVIRWLGAGFSSPPKILLPILTIVDLLPPEAPPPAKPVLRPLAEVPIDLPPLPQFEVESADEAAGDAAEEPKPEPAADTKSDNASVAEIEVCRDRRGRATSVTLLRGSGSDAFDAAALADLRRPNNRFDSGDPSGCTTLRLRR